MCFYLRRGRLGWSLNYSLSLELMAVEHGDSIVAGDREAAEWDGEGIGDIATSVGVVGVAGMEIDTGTWR
eukprot:220391-Amorphochlora_amoeboformis.AAC.2